MALKKSTSDAASTKKSPMKSARAAASTKKATASKGAVASAVKKRRTDKEAKRADATKSSAARGNTRKENEEARVAAYVSAQLFQLSAGRSVQSGAAQRRKP